MSSIEQTLNTKKEFVAKGRFIRMSPAKVERVLNQIRGKDFVLANKILTFMPYKSCDPINKVLISAASNAKNLSNLSKKDLILKEAFVDKGPTLKRFRPRSQGRGFRIQKPMCHITLTLSTLE
uniref:Large ribosomal subunit protein uL22c n=2 Tax=Pavlovaceae TaxID=418969 RepID=M1KFP1_DIALT|nr:ribosomal protein L22 [Diacronema lutheri]YP_009863752.1 ribosomal protein L22 [Pavlova sp. NIVA-4/92]AGE93730.1 ribosomal protein L22 [Diacronema lutheri]QKE31083.1 ribosomal protein L22 [Pavlova sp. NIVA-4/92]|mmetsp:Transcript_11229/g.35454  ORF Transcript_11229/g.35454 Transcript_11229/m.35454 type:complete len:123 (+) Transcript_11229:2416-2784(+)